jgi:hypothetical protein
VARSSQWGGSLHQTFRLLPPSSNLAVFLSADGETEEAVLSRLPYEVSRAHGGGGGSPDPKRYRDGRHVYQSVGLLFEDSDRRVRLTDLGKATHRWLGQLSLINSPVLGRHAAYALTACQLRNPTRPGQAYADDVQVFPFAFIWRAMLALDDQISSDELNRAIFRVTDQRTLDEAIDRIARCRRDSASPSELGDETITVAAKNDRVIPWMALASFGWLLMADKRESGGMWYKIRPRARQLLRESAQIVRKHRDYSSAQHYVEHISDCACLPRDVR